MRGLFLAGLYVSMTKIHTSRDHKVPFFKVQISVACSLRRMKDRVASVTGRYGVSLSFIMESTSFHTFSLLVSDVDTTSAYNHELSIIITTMLEQS